MWSVRAVAALSTHSLLHSATLQMREHFVLVFCRCCLSFHLNRDIWQTLTVHGDCSNLNASSLAELRRLVGGFSLTEEYFDDYDNPASTLSQNLIASVESGVSGALLSPLP